jgi:hypothetical protein
MPGHISAAGPLGQVRWGYLPALTFGAWRYEGLGRTGTLTAQILECDELRIEQHPLVVIVPMGQHEWRWSVESLQRSGATITITVARL